MDAPPRFFFLHLQKTGGTALFQRLRDGLGPAAVYPTPADQGDVAAVIDVDHLRATVPTDVRTSSTAHRVLPPEVLSCPGMSRPSIWTVP